MFYMKSPTYERTYYQKKRKFLEDKMKKEQMELEQFVAKQKPKGIIKYAKVNSHFNILSSPN